jgi:hypothetical protein
VWIVTVESWSEIFDDYCVTSLFEYSVKIYLRGQFSDTFNEKHLI